MSTRPPDPRIQAIAAQLRKDLQERADMYGSPLVWEPVWKRPRKPKSRAAKKAELRKQRKRLRNAGQRRFAPRQSRRPRSRQSRIGNAAARCDARALSRVRHSNAWLW
ncbi:hypothetical protein [Streptomyces sp. NPDC005953]|uniref:hypothetical protein n=1 Tax=Streptomyces sp. NPDC005953 TaxID=3156719 RepID=UPI0033E1295D